MPNTSFQGWQKVCSGLHPPGYGPGQNQAYSHKPFIEVFLTSKVVLYCVKRSLNKRSLIKLFTQAHWLHYNGFFKLVDA